MSLPRKESLTVEFKSDVKDGVSDRALVEEVVGMANSEGGEIYVGIEDDGSVSGAKKNHLDPLGVRSLVANLTVPPIFVEADILMADGKEVLRIKVPLSTSIAATSSGKVVQRLLRYDGAPEMKPMFPYEFESRRSYLLQVDPSKAHLFRFAEADLDSESLEMAMRIVNASPSADKSLLGLTKNEFLSSLEAVVIDSSGNPCFTLAGLLLFGKKESIRGKVPTYGYLFQRLRGGAVIENESFNDNIVKAFDRFAIYSKTIYEELEYIDIGVRYGVAMYDGNAIREGFANAIAHRDYGILGNIRVCTDETGFLLSSPGGLIHGLARDKLIAALPRGRNPLLSDCLKRLGFCERTGRGVDRIYASQARFGKRWPDYDLSDSQNVTLYIPRSSLDIPFARFTRRRCEETSLLGILTLSFLRKIGHAKAKEVASILGVGEGVAQGSLDALREEGLIERKGDSYNLPEEVIASDQSKAIGKEEMERMVLSFASSHEGYISSADVQELFGIDGNKSFRLLKDLEERGVLESIAKGRYAKYRLK